MNPRNSLFCVAAAILLGGCAPVQPPLPPGPAPTPVPVIPADVHPGFDVGRYPGEALLQAWRGASPYQWVGYYLPAPCHRDTSWVGTRPVLERLGWGVAVLYVGQQVFEDAPPSTAPPTGPVICSRTLLTAERGRADAQDAARRAQAEGFAPGSVVFLDVERSREIPAGMAAYYGAWTDEMLRDGRYLPGTYAHRDNAPALFALAQAAYARAGRTEAPPFWVAAGSGFALDRRPEAGGLPFALAWQGVVDQERTWGGATLRIDENVAGRRSPSEPAPR